MSGCGLAVIRQRRASSNLSGVASGIAFFNQVEPDTTQRAYYIMFFCERTQCFPCGFLFVQKKKTKIAIQQMRMNFNRGWAKRVMRPPEVEGTSVAPS